MGLSWIFLYEAYVRIGVGLSSITYYCGPVIVMLSAPLVFHKKLNASQYMCFVVVFAGIMLVSLPEIAGAVLILGGAVVTTVNDQRVEKTEETYSL